MFSISWGRPGFAECGLITGLPARSSSGISPGIRWGSTFIHQETINGTAGAAKLGRPFVGEDPFLMTYGDIWCGAAITGAS